MEIVRLDRINDAVVKITFNDGRVLQQWGEFDVLARRLDLRVASSGKVAIRVV